MTPESLIRRAALAALASAAANTAAPDFSPLSGAQVFLGQSWPSQSPPPGSAPLPNQLLLYAWDTKSETRSGNATAPQFESVLSLVIEARVETKSAAAQAVLPDTPSSGAVSAAVDYALEALSFAVKKAVCQYIQGAAMGLNDGSLGGPANTPIITEIRRVDITARLAEGGQRIAGNAGILFELVYGETFEPLIPNALNEISILINPEAGALANSGNTGNGAIGAVTVGLGAMPGTYALLFTSATGFTVTPPDGSASANGMVGTAFAALGLGFTVTAGTAAFVAGDGFAVTVEVQLEDVITFI